MSTTSRYAMIFKATALERIEIMRAGIPAASVHETGTDMGMSEARLLAMLALKPVTVQRCRKSDALLPPAYSERIIGLYRLIGQVESMVAESGDASGFRAARWLADWLTQPLGALNHAKPADFMDTMEGQRVVARLLAKLPSGAYA